MPPADTLPLSHREGAPVGSLGLLFAPIAWIQGCGSVSGDSWKEEKVEEGEGKSHKGGGGGEEKALLSILH